MSKDNGQKRKSAGFWWRFTRNRSAVVGLIAVSIVVFAAVFANLIAPNENVMKQNYDAIMQPPGNGHLFGTDQLGRDLFARIIYGSRYSLLVGLTTSLLGMLLGGALGAVAGYFGGRVDQVIMRILDVVISIPAVL
ncbi:MAG: ABC transporter permease, partial [Firmicutes bacterium]|nr:ABC transporter permease [Bacillota bacterium]